MARKKQSEGDLVTRYEAKYIVPSELVPRERIIDVVELLEQVQ